MPGVSAEEWRRDSRDLLSLGHEDDIRGDVAAHDRPSFLIGRGAESEDPLVGKPREGHRRPPAIGCRGVLAALRYNRAFTTRPRCPARVLAADMTPERFKQIERLFHEARARPAALRGASLVEACG